jgi:hypothetical protein
MHEAVMEWVARFAPTEPVIGLDIGGRDINGSVQSGFNPASTWEVVDLRDGPLVTWVGDFLAYESTEQFEVITCTEVGEHFQAWPELIARAAMLLEPEGVFIFTAAAPGRGAHSAIDGGWELYGISEKEKKEIQVGFCGENLPLDAWVRIEK